MKTFGIYLVAGLVAMLLYCRCGDRWPLLSDLFPTGRTAVASAPISCNDEQVLQRLREALAQEYDGVYDIARDYIVEWKRLSADHAVCRAKSIYKAPLTRRKIRRDDTAGLLDAVNEVFGLTRKPGDAIWVTFDLYRTLRNGEEGGYLFVDILGRGEAPKP